MSKLGAGTTGPAVDDVQADGAPGRRRDRATATAVLEYHDTAVGRLPCGPAADAALAAAAATAAPPAPKSRNADVLDLGAAWSRGILKRFVPALAAALAAAIAIAIRRRARS
jgi:hypothetical protein